MDVQLESARVPRLPLRVIQLGAILIVLAAATFFTFELDRFFVPKELVLHLTALLGGLFAFRAIRASGMTRVDLLLLAFLGISAVSALFATNHWIAIRALAITASSFVLFRVGRALREAGSADAVLGAVAIAIVFVAILALLQAYGVESAFFSVNRAPGGTLGNRNFVAHAAAFGLPILLMFVMRGNRLAPFGAAILTAILVLTRSRGAWLAFASVLVLFLCAFLLVRVLRRDSRTWRRIGFTLFVTAIAIAAALLLPNRLRWRSENPYLETMKRVADYEGGSGHGRLLQYQRSLLLAAHHPLFGVGPGNWPVRYPGAVPANDPSLNDSEPGTTANPWPSSDWIAFVTERGPLATALLALAFLSIASGGLRQLRNAVDFESALSAVALLGVLVATGVAGAFDAVLLVALPAMLVWLAIGSLHVAASSQTHFSRAAILLTIALSALGAFRSAAQLAAMHQYETRTDRAALERASRLDPGNYRLHLRLARSGKRAQRCEHARAAHDLFPSAQAAKELSRRCE
jgi:O-antigen ligase